MVVKIQTYLLQFSLLFSFWIVMYTVLFVNYNLANSIVSGKYFWFYFSIGIYAIVSIPFIIKRYKKGLFPFTLFDFLILLYGIITIFISSAINQSEAITKHILLALIIAFYFYGKVAIRIQKSNLFWMILAILLTGLIEAIWGLRQLYGFDYSQHARFKLTGSFFNPGPYACYLSVILPVAFYYLLRNSSCCQIKLRPRYWPVYLRWGIAVVTVAAISVVLPAAMSRASWLAATGGCGMVILYYLLQNRKVRVYYHTYKKRCIGVLPVLLLLVVIGCIGMYYLKKDSADGRILIWKISTQAILHHPKGVGIGNFSGAYGQEQAAYFTSDRGTEQERYVAGNPEYGFNEFLQICLEQGILPFLLYMIIVVHSLYVGCKRRKVAPTASLVALLIASMTSYPFSVLPFLIVLAFLLAWIHADENGKSMPELTLYFTLAGVVLTGICLYNRYPTYDAYKKWKRCSLLYHSGVYQNAVKEYRLIYPLLSDQLTFLFEYAQCLSKSEQYEESNDVLSKAARISCDPMLYNIMGKNYQALRQYDKAEQCYEMSANIVPNRIYPYYLMALMYEEMGEYKKAKVAAQIVLAKEPKVQSTAIREMRDNMKKWIDAD